MNRPSLSPCSARDCLLSHYDALLLDLDGTVHRGDTAVPGVGDVVATAREREIAVRFVTNNAARSPDAVAAGLRGFGVDAAAGDVNTSAQAAAAVLADRLPGGATVLVVGTEALACEIRDAGLTPVETAYEAVAAVVQGFSEDTGWRGLAEACVAIRRGALWVACNADPTLPTERGPLPGNGSLVAALSTATGVEPLVAGKPDVPLLREAAAAAGGRHRLVVGDRLGTDIAGATRVGFDALLVLSGVTDAAALLAAIPEQRPRYLGADVHALLDEAGRSAIAEMPGWKANADGDTLEVDGDGDTLDLLRTLCARWWAERDGAPTLHARSEGARRALAELRLAV